MTTTVVIVGALDTKGQEFAYLKELIENQGLDVLVIDFGVLGKPYFTPDISREAIAEAAGTELNTFHSGKHKDKAMKTMADGLAIIVRHLYDQGKLDGIISMGGSGGTFIATAAMRTLPVGVPKVMVSTVAGGDVSPYAGAKDITFIPSIVDVSGMNRISQVVYKNAAGAIVGMVKMPIQQPIQDRPLITASMFGNTTQCVDRARKMLEDHDYEVLVFHATGTGGKTMESLITDGFISANLDITTTELADEVCGGVLSAGPERLLASARAGIPTVLVPGCVDMVNFWAKSTVPEKYRSRNLYEWNPNVTLLRTNPTENAIIGEMIARAANESRGPVAILIPLLGVSQLDSPGGAFWDPEADLACFHAIKQHLKPGIQVKEMDNNINDPEFADEAARTLITLIDSRR